MNALGLVQKNIDEIGAAVPLNLLTHIKCNPVSIKLRKDAEPYSLPTARRVSIPLFDKVKAELQRKENAGVIEAVTEATDRCAPMVPVLNKNGSIWKDTDFKKFANESAKEPIMSTKLPKRPFEMVDVDICEFKGQNYLIVIDYYSRYLEILLLSRLTSEVVIAKFKSVFAHHGIPETVVTDNGRQFASSEFQRFVTAWNFTHVTSSPYFPQSNGEAERAVQEAKKILAQSDPMLALMIHRSTPTTATGYSPAELAMGRRI